MITDEDLKLRCKGIGGSDAGVLMGYSPWKTVHELYLEKIGEPLKTTPFFSRYRIDPRERGTVLEPFVMRLFEHTSGYVCDTQHTALVHAQYPYMRGNIDAWAEHHFLGERCIVELKTADISKKKQWELEGLPKVYWAQVQHYMSLAQLNEARVFCLFGDEQFFDMMMHYVDPDELITSGFHFTTMEFCVPADLHFQGALVRSIHEFWECVEKRIPPETIHEKATADVTYCLDERPCADVSQLIESIRLSQADVKNAQEEIARDKAELIEWMKDEEVDSVVCGGSVVASLSRRKKPTTLDSKRLKAEMPKIYAEFAKVNDDYADLLKVG